MKPRKPLIEASTSTIQKRSSDVLKYLKAEAGKSEESVVIMKAKIVQEGYHLSFIFHFLCEKLLSVFTTKNTFITHQTNTLHSNIMIIVETLVHTPKN